MLLVWCKHEIPIEIAIQVMFYCFFDYGRWRLCAHLGRWYWGYSGQCIQTTQHDLILHSTRIVAVAVKYSKRKRDRVRNKISWWPELKWCKTRTGPTYNIIIIIWVPFLVLKYPFIQILHLNLEYLKFWLFWEE